MTSFPFAIPLSSGWINIRNKDQPPPIVEDVQEHILVVNQIVHLEITYNLDNLPIGNII